MGKKRDVPQPASISSSAESADANMTASSWRRHATAAVAVVVLLAVAR
jgi:hypothetical protein